jgi:hypothetical protein
MRWRFYLIDRDNVKTRIDEPGGWNSFTLKIKRHPERHGTFRELQSTDFKFYDTAMTLLKAEHDLYGVRGVYDLVIDGMCGFAWQEMYRGRIGFDTYKFVCSDSCYVSASVDQVGPVIDFINRFDQKVDLSSSIGFDGAALTDYDGLSKNIMLPSKAILLRSRLRNISSSEYIISNDSGFVLGFPTGTGSVSGALNVPFDTVDVNAIKDCSPQSIIDFFNNSNSGEQPPELIYNNPDQDLNCRGNTFEVDFRVKGSYKNLVSGSGSHTLSLSLKKGTNTFSTGATTITGWILSTGGTNPVVTIAFDKTYTGAVTLADGEKLWLDFFLEYVKTTTYTPDVRLQIDVETFFNAEVTSKCEPTQSKVSMINETASRVIESITNNQLKLYSEYYGRTDSEPYAMTQNGCAGLRAVTTGLDIRRAKLADGSDPKMFLSMKDVFESLSAIDNIGVGPDDVDKIVMEPWKFFYQDDVVFTCSNIQTLEKSQKPDECYSVFRNGYAKWESEDFNGLDEFLTKREWRTSLTNIQNTLEKLCNWIASGYAWEVTRRKVNDSKDWRYDNDTFITCLVDFFKGSADFAAVTDSFNIIPEQADIIAIGDQIEITGTTSNNGTFTVTNVVTILNSIQVYVSGSFVNEVAPNTIIRNITTPFYRVEVQNISGGTNILDPDTVYNFRISPVRNALRWFDYVVKCYKNITNTDKLIFSSADGNYVAEGDLIDTAGCKLETGSLAENEDLSITSFTDADEATPITEPERVVFKYPVSFTEYNMITASPYGLIEYISKCERGEGWIDEIEYNPEDGTAKFTLIPKVEA